MNVFLSAMLLLSLPGASIRSQWIAQAQQPSAQHPPVQVPTGPAKSDTTESGEEPDDRITVSPVAAKANVQANVKLAWQMLEDAVSGGKVQSRIDAVNAVGMLSAAPQAEAIVAKTVKDSERDVRLATVIAMGNMREKRVIALLREALADKAPDVSFAAAAALWRKGDHSGESILSQVLTGDRKAAAGFIGQGLHTAERDLHNPAMLATMGAEQGAYALLGPFGIGLDAFKVIRGKGPSGNSARVIAADLLAKEAKPSSRADFLTALGDKDYFVRIAAAHALGAYHGKEVNEALLDAFTDPKPAVRYVAAASYIRANAGQSSRTVKPPVEKQ